MGLDALRIGKKVAFYLAILLPILVLGMAGCGVEAPQNTFSPAGEVAEKQRTIFYMAMWPAVAILIGVWVVLVVALIRYRRRPGRPLPKQVHGNPVMEVMWTLAPLALLLGLAVPMVSTIFHLGRNPKPEALRVRVIGHQWVWEFQYPTIVDENGKPLTILGTPDRPPELHVPVGREIALEITSADVIHSFWVPRLGGKMDAIPGKFNHMWLIINKPGVYPGQCAEFCGLLHADMRLLVVAHDSEEDFQRWAQEMLARQSKGGG